MLNLFGAIANGLGRALPGYMNGYRMAIQDNWNDLNQYNKVQEGQIGNAFSELTFPLAYNMYADRAGISRMGALNTGIDFTKRLLGLPGEAGITEVNSAMGPGLQMARINAAMNNFAQSGQTNDILMRLIQAALSGQQGGGTAMMQDPHAALQRTQPTAAGQG